jgi:hypothetical protein
LNVWDVSSQGGAGGFVTIKEGHPRPLGGKGPDHFRTDPLGTARYDDGFGFKAGIDCEIWHWISFGLDRIVADKWGELNIWFCG